MTDKCVILGILGSIATLTLIVVALEWNIAGYQAEIWAQCKPTSQVITQEQMFFSGNLLRIEECE
jgi:hypothetical protein